jgi:uncharacterized phage protein gp47/JayE
MPSTYSSDGVTYAKYADIVQEMNDDIRGSLGNSVNLDSDSFIGYMRDLTAMTEALANEIDQQVFDASTINNSSGVHLDANVSFVGLERTGFQYSTIEQIQLHATKACTVPAGTKYRTDTNVVFKTDEDLVFTGSGYDTVAGTCTVAGYKEVGIGELKNIVNSVNGIDEVSNLTEAVPGNSRKTDSQLKKSHTLVTATAGRNDVDSIYESLFEIPVSAAKIIDNDTDEYDGLIPPHHMRVIVIGGTDEEVATAIWNNKVTGCPTYGGDSYECHSPSYGNIRTINFDRGDENSTIINIYFEKKANFPDDGENTISEAIAAIFEEYTLGSTVNYDHIKGICYSVPGIELKSPFMAIGDEYNSPAMASIENDDTTIPTLDIVRDDSGRIISSNITFNEI